MAARPSATPPSHDHRRASAVLVAATAALGETHPHMKMRRHRIEIARDLFKFSCAHMTVFPDGSKERLHGHNYLVGIAVELDDISFSKMVPFAPIKAAVAELCAEWKERTIVAEGNSHFTRLPAQTGLFGAECPSGPDREYAFSLCGERYVLPAHDVLALPIDNASVEQLANHMATRLIGTLADILAPSHVVAFEVLVTESPGQGARAVVEL